MKSKEALLLVGHGSKLPYSKNLIIELSEKLKNRNLFSGDIYIGLMEFNHPTIPESLMEAINNGYKKIIVVPIFLASGIHTTRDIPRILNLHSDCVECDDHNSENNDLEIMEHEHNHNHSHTHVHLNIPNDVEIIYKEPLGSDEKIVDIIIDRIFNK